MCSLFLSLVWAIVSVMLLLEKRAKEQPSAVSLLPGFPVMPLIAWRLAVILDLLHPRLGFYLAKGSPLIFFGRRISFCGQMPL